MGVEFNYRICILRLIDGTLYPNLVLRSRVQETLFGCESNRCREFHLAVNKCVQTPVGARVWWIGPKYILIHIWGSVWRQEASQADVCAYMWVDGNALDLKESQGSQLTQHFSVFPIALTQLSYPFWEVCSRQQQGWGGPLRKVTVASTWKLKQVHVHFGSYTPWSLVGPRTHRSGTGGASPGRKKRVPSAWQPPAPGPNIPLPFVPVTLLHLGISQTCPHVSLSLMARKKSQLCSLFFWIMSASLWRPQHGGLLLSVHILFLPIRHRTFNIRRCAGPHQGLLLLLATSSKIL